MNKAIGFLVDCIVFIVLPFFIFGNVKFSEVRKRRYENDHLYTDRPKSWDVALFLHERAIGRINLLQTKLSGLLSVLSILTGVFGLTGVFEKKFPTLILVSCLLLAFLGLMMLLGPLTISTSIIVDLNRQKNTSKLRTRISKDFSDVLVDLGCRADFYADCLKTTKSLIVLAVLLFALGMVITLLGPQNVVSIPTTSPGTP